MPLRVALTDVVCSSVTTMWWITRSSICGTSPEPRSPLPWTLSPQTSEGRREFVEARENSGGTDQPKIWYYCTAHFYIKEESPLYTLFVWLSGAASLHYRPQRRDQGGWVTARRHQECGPWGRRFLPGQKLHLGLGPWKTRGVNERVKFCPWVAQARVCRRKVKEKQRANSGTECFQLIRRLLFVMICQDTRNRFRISTIVIFLWAVKFWMDITLRQNIIISQNKIWINQIVKGIEC